MSHGKSLQLESKMSGFPIHFPLFSEFRLSKEVFKQIHKCALVYQGCVDSAYLFPC